MSVTMESAQLKTKGFGTPSTIRATGTVEKAFGNLLHVQFQGNIRQGEVAFVEVEGAHLKGEVIEIMGDGAKIQIFDDTSSVQLGLPVTFTGELLEAELGPGLLGGIVDGLQNPLGEVSKVAGSFLPRGLYLSAIDKERRWEYTPTVAVGDVVERGDTLGTTMEGRFKHHIMVPFTLYGKYTITWVTKFGSYPVDTVVARAKDVSGHEVSFTMLQKWPIKMALSAGEKITPSAMMKTGCRIIDTQFPLMKGGTFCTPGPFGAGKTVLQHHLSKYSEVDIVIVCACGERAGEVVELLREFPHLIDPYTNETLMTRTIIICNTSSMPVAARESSIYMGVTMGEYYRQMGLNVLLLADSTSRWAQALREISGRLEEIPGEEAFPAYLSSRIAEFYERSGVIVQKDGRQGTLTIGGAVSPAGGNFEEPVTQATLSVVGAFLGLSRTRSDARRYPAIDPLISYSKYVTGVSRELSGQVEGWGDMVSKGIWFLRRGDEIAKRMEVVGEEGTPINDLVVYLKAELYDFCYLQQNSFDAVDRYAPLERQMALFQLVNRILDLDVRFPTHDAARQCFLSLQNQIKNLNFLPYDSDEYRNLLGEIETAISEKKSAKT